MSDYGHALGTIALIERLERDLATRGLDLEQEVEAILEQDRQRKAAWNNRLEHPEASVDHAGH